MSVIGINQNPVYFLKYHDKKDIVDIELDTTFERGEDGRISDHGMRRVKYHCSCCKLIFGYDRPVECPGCGSFDSMRPGLPGRLVRHMPVSKNDQEDTQKSVSFE